LSSVSCQFDNIIMPMVIIAMLEGKDWMIEMIQGWAEESGIDLDLGSKEELYKWFGQNVE